jgi:hypothetical protein
MRLFDFHAMGCRFWTDAKAAGRVPSDAVYIRAMETYPEQGKTKVLLAVGVEVEIDLAAIRTEADMEAVMRRLVELAANRFTPITRSC